MAVCDITDNCDCLCLSLYIVECLIYVRMTIFVVAYNVQSIFTAADLPDLYQTRCYAALISCFTCYLSNLCIYILNILVNGSTEHL